MLITNSQTSAREILLLALQLKRKCRMGAVVLHREVEDLEHLQSLPFFSLQMAIDISLCVPLGRDINVNLYFKCLASTLLWKQLWLSFMVDRHL